MSPDERHELLAAQFYQETGLKAPETGDFVIRDAEWRARRRAWYAWLTQKSKELRDSHG